VPYQLSALQGIADKAYIGLSTATGWFRYVCSTTSCRFEPPASILLLTWSDS